MCVDRETYIHRHLCFANSEVVGWLPKLNCFSCFARFEMNNLTIEQ